MGGHIHFDRRSALSQAEHLLLFDTTVIETIDAPGVVKQLHASGVIDQIVSSDGLKLLRVGSVPVALPNFLVAESVLAAKSYGPISIALVNQDQEHFASLERCIRDLRLPMSLFYRLIDSRVELADTDAESWMGAIDEDLLSDSIFSAAGSLFGFRRLLDTLMTDNNQTKELWQKLRDTNTSPDMKQTLAASLGEHHQPLFTPLARLARANRMLVQARQGFSVSGRVEDKHLIFCKLTGSYTLANNTSRLSDFEALMTNNRLPNVPSLIDSGRLTMQSVLRIRDKHQRVPSLVCPAFHRSIHG